MTSHSTDVEEIRFTLPRSLVEELRRTVPRSERNTVAARALKRELRRVKLLTTLAELAREPVWTSAAHPELATGKDIDAYVGRMRAAWQSAAID